MSKDMLLLALKMELSDLVFEQHTRGCYATTAVMIATQIATVIMSVAIKIFRPEINLRISTFNYKLNTNDTSNCKY